MSRKQWFKKHKKIYQKEILDRDLTTANDKLIKEIKKQSDLEFILCDGIPKVPKTQVKISKHKPCNVDVKDIKYDEKSDQVHIKDINIERLNKVNNKKDRAKHDRKIVRNQEIVAGVSDRINLVLDHRKQNLDEARNKLKEIISL